MVGLALAVVGIALPDSLNPSLIVAAVYLALGPHATRRLIAFTAAAFLVTLAGGVIIALGLGDLVIRLLPTLSRSVRYQILAVLGIALIGGGVVIWWRRAALGGGKPSEQWDPRADPSAPADHASAPPNSTSAALAGAGIAGVEFLTAFPYFAAIAMVVGSSESAAAKTALIVLYNAIYVLPLIAITVTSAVMGDRANHLIAPVGDWVATRWPVIVALLVFAAGLGLTVYALLQLT